MDSDNIQTPVEDVYSDISNPDISVIIVCYNFERYIGDCIQSILAQTLTPAEIIICDDCSTDRSWEIIQLFAAKHPQRICAIRQEKNLGACDNATVGFKKAAGALISAIDGDDRWLPDKLKLEYEALRANPRAKLAYSNVSVIDENGNKKAVWVKPDDPAPPEGDVLLPLFTKNFFRGLKSVFRNELIYKHVYNEFEHDRNVPVHLDWDFKIRICAKYQVVYTNAVLVEYRNHSSNISQNFPGKLYDSAEYVISKNLPLFQTRSNVEIAHALTGANTFLNYLGNRVNKQPRLFTVEDVFGGRSLE